MCLCFFSGGIVVELLEGLLVAATCVITAFVVLANEVVGRVFKLLFSRVDGLLKDESGAD